VVTVSVPWVPPLELLLDEELLPDEELLLDEVEDPLLELLEVDEDGVEPLPPQPATARQMTRTNGPSAVWRISALITAKVELARMSHPVTGYLRRPSHFAGHIM